jgi:hypothetical protein
MQKNNTSHLLGIAALILVSLTVFSCGGKKQSDVVATPTAQNAPAVDCKVWKNNQTFMSASYGLSQSKGDKIYINKLSIEQLMNSLKLESDPDMDKTKSDLIDSLDHAPKHDDPLYTIEFTQGAISLRDRLAINIQSYIDKCAE